jgi:chromosome segregation ATPase
MPLSRLISFAAAFVEQLAMLDIKPGDQDSAANSITTLKNELEKEKQAREKAQMDAETLPRAIEELKKMED